MNDSLIEALERSLCREEARRVYYEEVSGSDKASRWSQLFRDLAKDAAMNVSIIQKTAEGMREGEGWDLPDQVRACEFDPELGASVQLGGVYRELAAMSGPGEALSGAMDREMATLHQYAEDIAASAGRAAQFHRYLAERSGRRLEALRAAAEEE